MLIQELPDTPEGFTRFSVELLEEVASIHAATSWLRGFQREALPHGCIVTIWPANCAMPLGYRIVRTKLSKAS